MRYNFGIPEGKLYMATQYQPERPETGAPSYKNEDGRTVNPNARPARPQTSRFGEAQPGAQRPHSQRPANAQPRRTPSPEARRRLQKKHKARNRMYAMIAVAVVAVIAIVVLCVCLIKPGGNPSSNPTTAPSAVPATETPTAEPTVDVMDSANAMANTEASHSESLAAMLGNSETVIEGLAADQMAVISDLAVNDSLPSEWMNILLLGSDERKLTESARTDSMIICSINTNTGEVKLTSIMRDLAVNYDEIGDYNGTYRINAANYFGGEALAMRVVNECFGLNIEHYVRVNFYGFQQIAQQLGGVEMDITEEEMKEINYRIVEQAKAAYKAGVDESALPNQYLKTFGENTHLDGRQTLAYARIRKLDGGDYARSERQRKVLVALMNKLQGADAATLLGVANAALPHIKTNLSPDTILSVALKVLQSGLSDVESFRLPINNSYTQETRDGQDMLYDCNWEKNASELYYFIYE